MTQIDYTVFSGTTGLPELSNVSLLKLQFEGHAFRQVLDADLYY